MNTLQHHNVTPAERRIYAAAVLPQWQIWARQDKRSNPQQYAMTLAELEAIRAELDAREAKP